MSGKKQRKASSNDSSPSNDSLSSGFLASWNSMAQGFASESQGSALDDDRPVIDGWLTAKAGRIYTADEGGVYIDAYGPQLKHLDLEESDWWSDLSGDPNYSGAAFEKRGDDVRSYYPDLSKDQAKLILKGNREMNFFSH